MRYRYEHAGELFFGMFLPGGGQLIGLCMATRSHDRVLTEESISRHEPQGTTICLHSVCVLPQYQRRGLGLQLLRAYLDHIDACVGNVKVLLLLTHEPLISFYDKAGFRLVGPSMVHHGSQPWFEMSR